MPDEINFNQKWFRCGICKTDYKTKNEAIDCEKRNLEIIKFNTGDKVKNILEPRVCHTGGAPYVFEGRVIEIRGPEPSDYEYEVKWLGAKPERMHAHVYTYIVEYRCPVCRELKSAMYYAPEIAGKA